MPSAFERMSNSSLTITFQAQVIPPSAKRRSISEISVLYWYLYTKSFITFKYCSNSSLSLGRSFTSCTTLHWILAMSPKKMRSSWEWDWLNHHSQLFLTYYHSNSSFATHISSLNHYSAYHFVSKDWSAL